jgi:outer membrane protein assembly factor BamB
MKRILILTLILCTCFVPVARSQQPGCKFSPLWAEFHKHNMKRWNRCENVLSVSNVGNLIVKWSYATGSYVFSSPAVTNGVVYVGSYADTLYALNASTGAVLWSYIAGVGGVNASPAVANGVVYFGSGDYNVYALNATTGALKWSYTTGSYVDSGPTAVANSVVYIGSDDFYVYALDAKTGAKLWSYTTGNQVGSSPALFNGWFISARSLATFTR